VGGHRREGGKGTALVMPGGRRGPEKTGGEGEKFGRIGGSGTWGGGTSFWPMRGGKPRNFSDKKKKGTQGGFNQALKLIRAPHKKTQWFAGGGGKKKTLGSPQSVLDFVPVVKKKKVFNFPGHKKMVADKIFPASGLKEDQGQKKKQNLFA